MAQVILNNLGNKPILLADAIIATTAYHVVVAAPYESLVVTHHMSGNKSGYVSLTVSPDGTIAAAHNGSGNAIPTGNLTADYQCVYNGVPGEVILTVHVDTGAHTVFIQGLISGIG